MAQPALVMVTSSFPISGDGSEAAGGFVADLVEELGKHVPVRVVAPGRTDARELWMKSVEIFRYTAPAQALSTLRLWHPADALRVLRVLHAGQRATEHAVAAGPTAHVLALWALPCGYWARRSARPHGIGYSAWTLGSDIWSLGRIPGVRSLLRKVLRDAEHCWSDGLKLLDDTQAIAGRPVQFLPSTRRIDIKRTEPLRAKPPYRLLFLGRWHPNKGVDLLLEALSQLDETAWESIERVIIAGGGPLEAVVHAGVDRLRQFCRPIRVMGFLDSAAAQATLVDSDYLLLPSRIESIPVVFSDAAKLGLPVIAMPVGDLPRLISEGDAGTLAARIDAASFASAIAVALESPPSSRQEQLSELAGMFSLQVAANRIIRALIPEG